MNTKKFGLAVLSLELLISVPSWAIDLEDPRLNIKKGDKIGVYSGSFDPLHPGHEKVIEESLKNEDGVAIEKSLKNVNYVFIRVDTEHNSYKPFRSPWIYRYWQMSRVFKENTKVITSPLEFNDAIALLKKKEVTFYRIIGSDNYILKKEESKEKNGYLGLGLESNWLVHWRHKDLNFKPKDEIEVLPGRNKSGENGDRKVTIAHLLTPESGLSSTQLRKEARTSLDSLKGRVNPLVFDWAKAFNPYRKTSVALEDYAVKIENGVVQKKFEEDVKNEILKKLPANIKYVVENGDARGAQGLSGELIYFVKEATEGQESQLRYVAKVFKTAKREGEFKAELEAMTKIETLASQAKLGVVAPVHVVAQGEVYVPGESRYPILMMTPAQGESLEKFLVRLDQAKWGTPARQEAMIELKKAFEVSGKALAQLDLAETSEDSISLNKKVNDYTSFMSTMLTSTLDSINKNTALFQPILGSRHVNQLKDLVEKKIEAFKKSPGFLSMMHDDPNSGNFFVDLKSQKGAFVDAAGASKGVLGTPAGEIALFKSSLHWISARKGYLFHQDEYKEMKRAFSDAYLDYAHNTGKSINNESLKFQESYWALLGISDDLNILQYESNPKRIEILKSDLQRCIEELFSGDLEPRL